MSPKGSGWCGGPAAPTWLLWDALLSEWKGPALKRPTSSLTGPGQRCDTSRAF